METTKSNRTRNIMIAILAALAITNGTTLYLLLNVKHEKEVVTIEKNTLNDEYNSVIASLEEKKTEIGQLKGKNDEMDKEIVAKQQMIEEEQNKLAELHEKNELTGSELNQARKMIGQYTITIAALQKKVEEYGAQNQQLTVEKEQLTADLSCEVDHNTQLTATNTVLTKKVDAGSYLQIPTVQVAAIKRKNNGSEVPVEKVKAAESLKISFETGANKVLDPGPLSLYVRIINPRGETLAVTEQGSGVIPETETGKPVQYSKKANIQYNQSSKKVTLYWTRYITDAGTYRVEVYQNGKVVGKGSVRLV